MANTLKVESPGHARATDALDAYQLAWTEYVTDRTYYIRTRYGDFSPEVKHSALEKYLFSVSEVERTWSDLKSSVSFLKTTKKL